MGHEIVPYTVEVGHIFMAQGNEFIRTVVGSSVAVCIWDKVFKCGIMNNYAYPVPENQTSSTTMYGAVSMSKMVEMVFEAGCKRENLVAQILGGASQYGFQHSRGIGMRNVAVARHVLRKQKIVVASEDVLGAIGRKIVFNVGKGNIAVVKVSSLRDSDWTDEF